MDKEAHGSDIETFKEFNRFRVIGNIAEQTNPRST